MNRHERRAAKARGEGPKRLVGFACFYKAMDNDGFNFAFMPPQFSPFEIKMFYDNIEKIQPEMDRDPVGRTFFLEQLKGLIASYNTKAFGTPTRPVNSTTPVQLDMKDIVGELMIIAANIRYLTRHGVIPDDEYNGMMYTYEG